MTPRGPSPPPDAGAAGASLYDALYEAATHHQAGRFAQAEAIYQAVLRAHPGNRDAHHNLGVLAMQRGLGVRVALPHFRAAWEADPSHAQHGLSYLRALVLAGDLDGARRLHAEGLRRGFGWPSVEMLAGGGTLPAREAPQAGGGGTPGRAQEEALAKAYAAGDIAGFESQARSVAERFPGHALGWKALGVAALHRGRRDEALSALRTAARLRPDDPETLANLGSVLLEAGLVGEAEANLRKAVTLAPRLAAAHCRLGDALLAQHRFPEAEAAFRQALAQRDRFADAASGLGLSLEGQARLDEAEASLRQALDWQPGHRAAFAALGALLVGQHRMADAEAHCRREIARDPSRVEAHYDLGTLLQEQGRLAQAEESYRNAIAVQPGHLESRSCLLFLEHYAARKPPEALLEEAKAYGALARARATAPFSAWTCDPAPGRLRVGLVSGDLREHPVGYFLEAILAQSGAGAIDWVAYPTYAEADALSGRLRRHVSAWTPLAGLSDEAAARRIQGDGIHLLVDLSGHTVHNRLPVFAWRPAPVQATWLGYFATTGLEEIDFILADRVGLPPELQSRFTETIHYLPGTRLCFTPPPDAPPVSAAPAIDRGYVTFGCFQALPKITDEALEAWGRILASCPGSRLRLQNASIADPAVASALRSRLAARGVDPARADLNGFAARARYLADHAQVDLLLDTFPYPGGTTTCEALWMGVPTLTLAGGSMIARQGASLLTAAGLADWVSDSPDDYVARAVSFAREPARLGELRQRLRGQVRSSPLFDAPRFARNLEAALRELWAAKGGRAAPR